MKPIPVQRADTRPVRLPRLVPPSGRLTVFLTGAAGVVPVLLLIGAWQWM